MELHHRSDRELLSDVAKLIGSHREVTAKLVAYLAEIEERRLHLQAGFSSMFDFCVKELRLSEGESFRRILAARLSRRFPVVCSLLASGSVHLSALELVHERLTEENHAELLAAASGKSKREIEALLAARFPRPDVPSRIRKLPDMRTSSGANAQSDGSMFTLESAVSRGRPEPSRAGLEPLSATRFKVEFTASAELREKLELCRDLMSHANPSRDLGVVFERAVELLLAELERHRLGKVNRPRHGRNARSTTAGRVTRATRRQVFERDGMRCSYVAPDGRRCEGRAFLELDHADPRALGGGDTAENLRVRCRAHNQLWAEEAYGREYVERRRDFCQQKRRRQREEGKLEARVSPMSPSESLEKVVLALKGMGFRDAQARRAVAEVERAHEPTRRPPIVQSLREAILFATSELERAG